MTQWLLNNALPLIATVLLAYSYIPQLVKTYRTKSVDDVSPAFWWSISAALALMTVNAAYVFYLTGGYGYLITEIINLSLAVAMLTLVLRYRVSPKQKRMNQLGRRLSQIEGALSTLDYTDEKDYPKWKALQTEIGEIEREYRKL